MSITTSKNTTLSFLSLQFLSHLFRSYPGVRVIYIPLQIFTPYWIDMKNKNSGFLSSDEEGQYIQLLSGRVRPTTAMKVMTSEDLSFANARYESRGVGGGGSENGAS